EVEGGLQLAGADIAGEARRAAHPRLGGEQPVAVVAVGHLAPLAEDLVDAVAVPVRGVLAVGGLEDVAGLADVPHALLLYQTVRDVDAEPVDAPVEPERQDLLEVLAYLGVGPVEVGLGLGEQVEVPLTVRYAGPGAAAEHAAPVVRWPLAVL